MPAMPGNHGPTFEQIQQANDRARDREDENRKLKEKLQSLETTVERLTALAAEAKSDRASSVVKVVQTMVMVEVREVTGDVHLEGLRKIPMMVLGAEDEMQDLMVEAMLEDEDGHDETGTGMKEVMTAVETTMRKMLAVETDGVEVIAGQDEDTATSQSRGRVLGFYLLNK